MECVLKKQKPPLNCFLNLGNIPVGEGKRDKGFSLTSDDFGELAQLKFAATHVKDVVCKGQSLGSVEPLFFRLKAGAVKTTEDPRSPEFTAPVVKQTEEMNVASAQLLIAATLWTLRVMTAAVAQSGGLGEFSMEALLKNSSDSSAARPRRRRFISSKDMTAILDYHNRVRSQVFPPAANMEYMVWDERLAKTAESWASQCVWDHGPPHVLRSAGQNLSIVSGRQRSILDMVRSWYDERRSFSYPDRCSGSVCTHYTQMVWATSSKIGCAVKRCSNMYVFGSTWKQATLLVCNYSIKGNWIGEAPYKSGRPCSACPSSYGGSCVKNQCDSGYKSRRNTSAFRG